jgi:hypothetical protein
VKQYRIEIRQAWWLWPYIWGLAIACVVFGREYDPVKFERTVNAAMRVKVVRNRMRILA